MNKKYLSVILFSALMLGTTGTFTSCKDYDDDINSLNERVEAVETLVNQLQTQIQNGAVITDVTKTENGVLVTLSNGNSFEVTNGTNGTNGSVVTIGDNGNWFIDGVDTGKPSRGESGTAGTSIYYVPGTDGAEEGYWVKVTKNADGTETREVTNTTWLPTGTVTAVWDTENQNLILSNVLGANGEPTTVVVPLASELKSLVFDVENENAIYMDGVESMEYKWIAYRAITIDKTPVNGTIPGTTNTV